MKVLFWNTNKNPNINRVLCEIIAENNISLVVLAEYEGEICKLSKELAEIGINMQEYLTVGCDRIKIMGVELNISPGRQTDYASFQIIDNKDIFCCIHLPSQIYNNANGMRKVAIDRIVADVCSTEKEIGTDNTIILGDFNINPYDNDCLNADKFHAIPYCKEILKRNKRIIAGEEFEMFYNPMWNFFGDWKKPFGTYYYSGNNVENAFWNIYDQVIIKPSLSKRFVNSSLKILTECKICSLLNRQGHPNKKISDHLPITFEILED